MGKNTSGKVNAWQGRLHGNQPVDRLVIDANANTDVVLHVCDS
jgi:hypothetical protein